METVEKSYELRAFCAKDIFPMASVLTQIGFKEFKDCFQSEDVKKLINKSEEEGGMADAESVGISIVMDIAGIVLANLDKCEKSLYTLLSQLTGMKKEEISGLKAAVFAELIVDVIQMEDLKDFIQVVSRFLK